MTMLIFIYVIVAAMSYTYLAGKYTKGSSGCSARKLLFVMMWPLHAFHAYIRMLKGWDQESHND